MSSQIFLISMKTWTFYTPYSCRRCKNRFGRRVTPTFQDIKYGIKGVSSLNAAVLATRSAGQLKALGVSLTASCMIFLLALGAKKLTETYIATHRITEVLEEAMALEQKPWHVLFSLFCNKFQVFYCLLLIYWPASAQTISNFSDKPLLNRFPKWQKGKGVGDAQQITLYGAACVNMLSSLANHRLEKKVVVHNTETPSL